MSNLYMRQETYNPDNYNWDIVLIGCGGMGSQIAHMLTMANLYRTLFLIDGDEFEQHNMNRVPIPPDNAVGRNKAVALRDHLKSLRPDSNIIDFPYYLEEGDNRIDIHPQRVIMAAEGEDAHNATRDHFALQIDMGRAIFVGGEQDEIELRSQPLSWFGEQSGYQDVWVGSTMGGAMATVYAMLNNMGTLQAEHGGYNGHAEIELNPLQRAQWQRRANELESTINELQQERDELIASRAGFKGQMRKLQSEVDRLKQQLNGDEADESSQGSSNSDQGDSDQDDSDASDMDEATVRVNDRTTVSPQTNVTSNTRSPSYTSHEPSNSAGNWNTS